MNEASEKEYRVFNYLSETDITEELLKLAEKEFTGSITFKFNFFQGGISNVNVGLDKSIKLLSKIN
jgi:hypothetical protein